MIATVYQENADRAKQRQRERYQRLRAIARPKTDAEVLVEVERLDGYTDEQLSVYIETARRLHAADKAVQDLAAEQSASAKDSEVNPKNIFLGNASESLPVKTGDIAARCKFSTRVANGYLRDLASLGLVTRHGNAGWLPVLVNPPHRESSK